MPKTNPCHPEQTLNKSSVILSKHQTDQCHPEQTPNKTSVILSEVEGPAFASDFNPTTQSKSQTKPVPSRANTKQN